MMKKLFRSISRRLFLMFLMALSLAACVPGTPTGPSGLTSTAPCEIPPGETRTCNFTDESGAPLVITVPIQTSKQQLTLTKTPAGDTPGKKDGIAVTPIRLLFNFDATSGKEKITRFDPPLTMTAKYNQGDLDKIPGKDPRRLKLFLFDRETKRWTVIETKVNPENQTLTGDLKSLLGEKDPEGTGYD